jgi:hypothetical protein
MKSTFTENDSTGEVPLDSEDWQVVFRVYDGSPVLALILAQHLEYLKGLVQSGPQGAIEGVEALDRAIDSLMPHTDFRDVDRNTYRLAVAGKLKPDHDMRGR